MNLSKTTKAQLVEMYSTKDKQLAKLSTQYAEAQGLAIELENELINLIIAILDVFKNAPTKPGLWGWLKIVWSSEFRKALVDLINYIKEHKLNKTK